MKPQYAPLSAFERATLISLKRDVAQHAKLSKEHAEKAGLALIEIRDKNLHRESGLGFIQYAKQELLLEKSHVYRLVEYVEVKKSPIGGQISNERQSRAIADVPEEKRAEVLDAVEQNGPVTARAIKETAAKIIDVPEAPEPVVRKDDTGFPIPERFVPLFDRAEEVEKVLRVVASIRGTLTKAQDDCDWLWHPVKISGTMTDLDKLYAILKSAVPYAVCPYCSGQTADACLTCKGRGVISKFAWDSYVPSELKEIRRKVAEQTK